MGFDVRRAVRFTPFYARQVGWQDHTHELFGYLGFMRLPDPKQFVRAVRDWQHAHPPLSPDGMLGPKTWRKMESAVKRYNGRKPPNIFGKGEYDGRFWVFMVDYEMHKNTTARRAPRPSQHRQLSDQEDRRIEEDAKLAAKLALDIRAALPMSGEAAAEWIHPKGPSKLATGRPISQTLQVGQKWKGPAGNRIVLGFSIAGSNYKGHSYVFFATESGQAYVQNEVGFEADLLAWVTEDLTRSLKPVKFMVDLTGNVLVGAIAASGWGGFLLVTTMGVTPWIIKHRNDFDDWIDAFLAVLAVRATLKAVAPTLYDKVFDSVLISAWRGFKAAFGIYGKQVAGDIPESIAADPKIIGRGVGALLAKVGKKGLAQRLTVVSVIILVLLEAIKAGAKAVPGAIKISSSEQLRTGKQIIDELRKVGVTVTQSETEKIFKEICEHPDEVKKALEKLDRTFEAFR